MQADKRPKKQASTAPRLRERTHKRRFRNSNEIREQGSHSEDNQRYVALDCEMVGVGPDGSQSALARVSVVDWEGRVMLDTFVRVEQPITDYRTEISGVKPSDVESDEAMDFVECRERVQHLLRDKVVVGHGLKNDFHVLNMTHPWYLVRDTTKFDPFLQPDPWHPSSFMPKKLKVLAEEVLGVAIQSNGTQHNSIEDARVSMQLYQKVQRKWEKAIAWKIQRTQEILSHVAV